MLMVDAWIEYCRGGDRLTPTVSGRLAARVPLIQVVRRRWLVDPGWVLLLACR